MKIRDGYDQFLKNAYPQHAELFEQLGEDVVRILVMVAVQELFEKLGSDQLDTILACIRTELLVADDLGVRAHLGFRA